MSYDDETSQDRIREVRNITTQLSQVPGFLVRDAPMPVTASLREPAGESNGQYERQQLNKQRVQQFCKVTEQECPTSNQPIHINMQPMHQTRHDQLQPESPASSERSYGGRSPESDVPHHHRMLVELWYIRQKLRRISNKGGRRMDNNLLLLRSGDVERNPGPSQNQGSCYMCKKEFTRASKPFKVSNL